MREPILNVHTEVEVPIQAARDWFLSLRNHPERYTFETHAGFEFESGDFGEVGARFTTRERFFFLTLELPFELTEVRRRAFSFRLRRPRFLQIWGRFSLAAEGERTLLSLDVGSEHRVGQLVLRCYPVAVAIHRQIGSEVDHVRRSMERVYAKASSRG